MQTSSQVTLPLTAQGSTAFNLQWINIDQLQVDKENYQRTKEPPKGPFNWDLFDPPSVGVRLDGTMWIIDGARRTELAQRSGVKYIPCNVRVSTGYEFEAGIFSDKSMSVASITPTNRLKAELSAGRFDAIDMNSIIQSFGFEFHTHGGGCTWPKVSAVSAIRALYKVSPTHLRACCRYVKQVWPEDNVALKGYFLRGLSAFLKRYASHENFDNKIAMSKLSKLSASTIYQRYRTDAVVSGDGVYISIAKGLACEYNKRRGQKLPSWTP